MPSKRPTDCVPWPSGAIERQLGRLELRPSVKGVAIRPELLTDHQLHQETLSRSPQPVERDVSVDSGPAHLDGDTRSALCGLIAKASQDNSMGCSGILLGDCRGYGWFR